MDPPDRRTYIMDPDRSMEPELRERLVEAFGELDPISHEQFLGQEGAAEPGPGLVLAAPWAPAESILGMLELVSRTSGEWSFLWIRGTGPDPEVLSFPIGYIEPLTRVVERWDSPGLGPGLISFRLALSHLSRIRHDINNPLTAALAETQLLLLDAEPGSESEVSLKVVEEQLRRIRDLAAEMTPLRVPAR